MRQSYCDLFPKPPECRRYHRVVCNAEKLWATLAVEVAGSGAIGVKLADAKPLHVAKGRRAERTRCLGASKGLSTMGMVYGFKLHARVK